MPMLRGFLSDVLFAFLASVFFRTLLKRNWGHWILLVVFSFIYAGNYEHILFNSSHLSVAFGRMGLHEEFISGSVLVKAVMFKFLVLLVLSLVLRFGLIWGLTRFVQFRLPGVVWQGGVGLVLCMGLFLPVRGPGWWSDSRKAEDGYPGRDGHGAPSHVLCRRSSQRAETHYRSPTGQLSSGRLALHVLPQASPTCG